MVKTKCAICDTLGNSDLVYSSTLDEKSFSTEVFSARRMPDRRHYAWVRCKTCGLLRSDPIEDANLGKLYEASTFDYSSEVTGLAKTYRAGLARVIARKSAMTSLLEVGGGNSFFLEKALELGIPDVNGIEPSLDAVSQTREDIKPKIKIGLMGHGIYPHGSFDLVTMFHVMDHLPDPLETLKACVATLKPNGILLIAVHNEKSWSARLLKNKSPIFDVEHTFLYSKKTAKALFASAGLLEMKAWSYSNYYSMAYLVQLTPLPKFIKVMLLREAPKRILQKIKVKISLGNIFVTGVKSN